MNSQINNKILKNLKDYLDANFKLIGFDYQRKSDIFSSALNDILTIKILCKCCSKCDPCNCQKIISFINTFSHKYELYIETQKISVNNHFEFHLFQIYIQK